MHIRDAFNVMIVSFLLVALGCGGEKEKKGRGIEPKAPVAKKAENIDGDRFTVKKTPDDMVEVNAILDNKIKLLGFTLDKDTVMPGGRVKVTWYWKSLKKVEKEWEYFTHFIDASGHHKGGANSRGPMRSVYKPHMWKVGSIVKDVETVRVPGDWSSPVIELRTGIWSGPQRMTVKKGPTDPENRIKGPSIMVAVDQGGRQALMDKSETEAVQVPWTQKAPRIDGVFEKENAWEAAVQLAPFKDTMTGSDVTSKTDVKLMWDERNLYIAVRGEDDFLTSGFKKRDSQLWKEDALDIFLAFKADGTDYFEYQVSPAGVVFDSYYSEYRKGDSEWSGDIEVSVSLVGTLNDDKEDTSWGAEIAIPWKAMEKGGVAKVEAGDVFKANFFRIDKGKKEVVYSGWSPPMRGDFHALERFGKIELVKEE